MLFGQKDDDGRCEIIATFTLSQILGREGPTVSTPPTQLSHNPNSDHSNMSLLNLKFKRRKVDSRDSDGKNKLST